MIYGGFEIGSFEAGRGLWHARILRTDRAPVLIDGIAFPALEAGFAWPDREAAIADAKILIDRLRQPSPTDGQTPPETRASFSPVRERAA
jgi:hypothetical protein